MIASCCVSIWRKNKSMRGYRFGVKISCFVQLAYALLTVIVGLSRHPRCRVPAGFAIPNRARLNIMMRKLAIASLLVAGVALSGSVLAQATAPQSAMAPQQSTAAAAPAAAGTAAAPKAATTTKHKTKHTKKAPAKTAAPAAASTAG
jgi:hypothetical protein